MIKKKHKHKKSADHPSNHHHSHTHLPKPPTKFLWILEAAMISFAVFIVLSIILILFLAATNHIKAQEAVRYVTGIAPTNNVENSLKKIHSTIGFELTINDQIQEGEGVITESNGSKVAKSGTDLYTPGSYSTINVYMKSEASSATTSKIDTSKSTYLSMVTSSKKSIIEDLKTKYGQNLSDTDVAKKYFEPISDQNKSYKLTSSEEVTIGGYKYIKNVYSITNNQSLKYTTKQTDYLTVQNDRPYKITIYENAGSQSTDVPQFDAIIDTVKFYPPESSAILSDTTNRNVFLGHTLSPLVATANAAAKKIISKDSSIQVVAKNNPSVVKVATFYCSDFILNYKSVSQRFTNACAGGTGSGFFINSQGYIGTNGHVVRIDTLEALTGSVAAGQLSTIRSYLDYLVKLSALDAKTANEVYSAIASGDLNTLSKLYETTKRVPVTEYKVIKENYDYAIQLADENIAFSNDIKNIFNLSNNIVSATYVDSNYNPLDWYSDKGFTMSDVAILKIEANNVPYSTIGNIESISQGSPITVIGFPGIADKNGLVSQVKNPPTSTKGQVSAVVDAIGVAGYKLIQSDVGIAPGNSGGPGFNNDGEVVGLATYGITQNSGSQVNYLRSALDLKKLAEKNKIALSLEAEGTQKIWEDGLTKFSKAYYSSAIDQFKQVKKLYPQNRLADEFIAKAEAEKKAGREAIPPETYFIIGAIVLVVFIVPGIILFVVVRKHRKRRDIHEAYNQQNVAQPTNAQPVPQVEPSNGLALQAPLQQSPTQASQLPNQPNGQNLNQNNQNIPPNNPTNPQ